MTLMLSRTAEVPVAVRTLLELQDTAAEAFGEVRPEKSALATAGAGRAMSPVSRRDIVEEWGHQSFPASDPPANW